MREAAECVSTLNILFCRFSSHLRTLIMLAGLDTGYK